MDTQEKVEDNEQNDGVLSKKMAQRIKGRNFLILSGFSLIIYTFIYLAELRSVVGTMITGIANLSVLIFFLLGIIYLIAGFIGKD